MQHLIDYVWMQPPDGAAAVRVALAEDPHILTQYLYRGYVQCDPPAEEKTTGGK